MATKKPLPIGSLVDSLWAERERKRALEEKMKEIEKGIEAQTLELLERMEGGARPSARHRRFHLHRRQRHRHGH